MIRKASILILALSFSGVLLAQTPQEEYEAWKRQARGEYNQYREDRVKEYQEFREKANAEYAAFLQEAWERMGVKPAEKPPVEPEPPKPEVVPQDAKPTTDPIPYTPPDTLPKQDTVPDVPLPVVPKPKPVDPSFRVSYYGTSITIHSDREKRPTLSSCDGKSVGKMWERLAKKDFDPLLRDCLEQKRKLSLGDWGFVQLVRKTAKAYYGKECNEVTLMSAYLLCQSGYQCRLARKGNKLLLLMPFDCKMMFNHPYIDIDGVNYFVLNMKEGDGEVEVFNKAFPKEHKASLRMKRLPKLAQRAGSKRTLSDKEPHVVTCSVSVNRNLIDFLNDYPLTPRWDYYALASLSDDVKKNLYPTLRQKIAGQNQKAAANTLLHWVQTAFDYKTDPEQFGVERPLFADESLYYPFCDCEDRSILFSILVHDLLGLDVVLLHFPGHLATAVHFTTKVDGDYLDLKGGRYIICDPTYIGAPVGMAMPQCKKQKMRVIKLR
jgi:hypothetical protein